MPRKMKKPTVRDFIFIFYKNKWIQRKWNTAERIFSNFSIINFIASFTGSFGVILIFTGILMWILRRNIDILVVIIFVIGVLLVYFRLFIISRWIKKIHERKIEVEKESVSKKIIQLQNYSSSHQRKDKAKTDKDTYPSREGEPKREPTSKKQNAPGSSVEAEASLSLSEMKDDENNASQVNEYLHELSDLKNEGKIETIPEHGADFLIDQSKRKLQKSNEKNSPDENQGKINNEDRIAREGSREIAAPLLIPCPSCGQALDPGDAFCKKCGAIKKIL